MANAISNTDDIIDSRQINDRIEELESERDEFGYEDEDDAENDTNRESVDAKAEQWAKENGADADELKALIKLREDGENYSEWDDGVTLIHERYFEEYARDLAADIGAIDPNATWPLNCID